MTKKGSRKYPEDDDAPLQVQRIDFEAVQAWHEKAIELRAQGWNMTEIGREVGKHKSTVQKFFDTEANKARYREQKRLGEIEARRDPVVAEEVRTYVRKYMQLSNGKYK